MLRLPLLAAITTREGGTAILALLRVAERVGRVDMVG